MNRTKRLAALGCAAAADSAALHAGSRSRMSAGTGKRRPSRRQSTKAALMAWGSCGSASAQRSASSSSSSGERSI